MRSIDFRFCKGNLYLSSKDWLVVHLGYCVEGVLDVLELD